MDIPQIYLGNAPSGDEFRPMAFERDYLRMDYKAVGFCFTKLQRVTILLRNAVFLERTGKIRELISPSYYIFRPLPDYFLFNSEIPEEPIYSQSYVVNFTHVDFLSGISLRVRLV